MSEGWVKIHRKLQDSKGYFSESFCRNMAWIDLILLANHDDNYFLIRGLRVDVKRGQIGHGLETLADRWKWSRGKAERFLQWLENDQKIIRQKNNITTLISLLNYEQYQQGSKADSKANDKADGQQTVKQTDINKNVKNDNNEKNEEKEREAQAPKSDDFIRFENWILNNAPDVANMKVPFTEDQFLKIKKLHPAGKITEVLKAMHNRVNLIKSYKSAYLTALNWLKPKENGTEKTKRTFTGSNGKLGTSAAQIAAYKDYLK